MPKKSASIVEQIHALAWAGNHQKAIELATQELDKPNLPVSLRMDLLDLRAESYIAQGKFDLALADASVMEKFAKKGSKIQLLTHAFRRKSIVQLQVGDLQNALKNATKSLKFAKNTKQKNLIALSLLQLGEVEFRSGLHERAINTAQNAIALFKEINNIVGEGRAYRVLAISLFYLNDTENAQSASQTSLDLCNQAGDYYGIGNALNALYISKVEASDRIKDLQRAKYAFEISGYRERQTAVIGNLALVYQEVGLYYQSLRLLRNVIEIDQAIGAKLGLMYDLANIIGTETEVGLIESAQIHLQEYEVLVSETEDPYQEILLSTLNAFLSFTKGDFSSAIRHQKNALRINTSMRIGRSIITLYSLSFYYLAAKKTTAALQTATKATNLHRKQSFSTQDGLSASQIWWQYTLALNANKKTKEANEALSRSYDFLLQSIASIRDVGLRRNALNKVRENREMLQAWLKEGVKLKLPKERLYAYLNIPSNTREPFARLTDTSQRLNLLKEISEIQTFLVEEATELSGAERVMLILEDGKKHEVAESILPVGEEAGKVLSSIKKHLPQARLTRTVQLIIPKKQGLSRIIAPLIAQNQVVGYLYADMDSIYGLFDDTDRDMLGMLANQAAVALENAGLVTNLEQKVNERTAQLQASVTETQRLLKESRTLGRVGRDISSSLDLEQVLENITSYAKDLLNADLSALLLPEQGGSKFRAVTALGIYANDLLNDVVILGDGLLGSVAKNKIGEIINDTHFDSRSIAISGTELIEHEHLLAVPLLEDNELRGLMAVWRIGAGREFNQNELNFLINLSRQAVVALKNAQLFSEAHESRLVAEQANKMKSAFLANMSHELRTPLNAIINFTELVQMGVMGEVNEEQKEALGYSLGSSKHLLQLINDVLDISKIQAGKLTLFLDQKVDLSNEIEDVLHMVEPLLKKQIELYEYDVKLVKDVDANLPLITCDRRRIRQVLLNLLSNAVKFTQKGSITLSVKRKVDHLEFAVIDTGAGIRQDMQTQIFEPFQQTEDGIKQVEGTGLGLPITKSLVEAHGGRIWLESEPGEGSAFFFILPTR